MWTAAEQGHVREVQQGSEGQVCVCGAYKEARRADGKYVLTPPRGPQPAQALRGGKHDSTETPLEDKEQGARLVLTQRSAVTTVTLKPHCNNVCDALG